jgi:dTDP-4-dehydrorhamnose reductase
MAPKNLVIGRGFVGRSLHASLGWEACPIGVLQALASPRRIQAAPVVVFASGTKDLAACEADPRMAAEKNLANAATLARLAGGVFVYVSTDYVFDGQRGGYGPGDTPNPKTAYGVSKVRGEDAVLAACPRALVVRTSHLMAAGCPWIMWLARRLAEGQAVEAWEDRHNTPTPVDRLAQGIVEALERDTRGIIHVAGSRRVNRLELFRDIAAIHGIDQERIVPGRCDSPFVPPDLSLVP